MLVLDSKQINYYKPIEIRQAIVAHNNTGHADDAYFVTLEM